MDRRNEVFAIGLRVASALATSGAHGQSWTFDDLPALTTTPFSQPKAGVAATFSVFSGAPTAFDVLPTTFPSTSGNALVSASSGNSPDLRITLSQMLTRVTFVFVLNTIDTGVPLTLQAFLSGANAGTASIFKGRVEYVVGLADFPSGGFDEVVIGSAAPDMAIDDVTATSLVPERAPLGFAAFGIVSLGLLRSRRRRRSQ